MSWFRNMKIATKLISSFIIVSLLAGALGLFGLMNMKSVDEDYTHLYENYGVSLGDLGSVGIEFNSIRVRLTNILLTDDMEQKKALKDEILQIEKVMESNLDKFGNSIQTENTYEAFLSLRNTLEQYNKSRDEVINLSLAGQNEQAIALLTGEGSKYARDTENAIQDMFDLRKKNGANISSQLTVHIDRTSLIMIIVIVLIMIVSIGFGIFISRMISKPISKLVESADQIADGDLNVEIDIDMKDEIGHLAAAFRKMSDNLNEIMGNIQNAADQVATGAQQISVVNVSMSQGSTEQASSVEQLTASIEEIASQTRQNADSSNEANELAEAAKQNAVIGNNQMREMLNAMDEINQASQNISRIIKVIDEIAFQTNILALNAAVEAARAGQHGKGFAVVAEEVRNLAARSANAAKETTEMIEGSIKKAEDGTKIANETANALQQIVDDVAKVATLIGDIATASNEQLIGINQINQGIMQVSQVVQTNSATLEESAATSEELASQADLLKDQVNRFKLKSQIGSYQAVEDISPELLELFEKMSDKKSRYPSGDGASSQAVAQPKKIDLSDNEFGKY